ncbi:hypothetical protein CBS101457_000432 [Exobasidium rhododendri]|nr:hypothetical protein CBS101457_000432 [Exobasidium rhododendri]
MAGCFSILAPKKGAAATSPSPPTIVCACCSFEALPEYSSHQKGRFSKDGAQSEKLQGIMAEVAKTIESRISSLDKELRDLSLQMWSFKEIQWQEHKTHDLFVKYLKKQPNWKVTPHAYGLETAFAAEFTHTPKGAASHANLPTIGFQSELDALPGVGHACGHNLIAISGVAASLGVAGALIKHDIAGRIILLGTPAEEAGGGKLRLLDAGAYKSMDACLMVHPAPFDSVGAMIAVVQIDVTYTGHTAHAGAAPWQGINAQDAGVLAYTNISALRQQIQPTHRVHGIIQGKDWATNVIPATCDLYYNLRAPTIQELEALIPRVVNCFQAAALATGCKVEIKRHPIYKNVANNDSLARSYQNVVLDKYDREVSDITFFASTDFGNVTFELPSLHAEYGIPLKDPLQDGNHTIGFADAAKTKEAHQLTLQASTAIAVVGAKFIVDEEYRKRSQKEWKEWKNALPKAVK